MTTTYSPGMHRFAKFVVAWTVLLFIAGALVTSNNAALSVPDWPKSFGTWFPSLRQLAGGAFFEHSHRVIAGGLGIFTLVLAVLIWLKDNRRWLRWFGVIAVAGVAVQAVLGGEVVRQLLQYWLPVIHACFAQIVFGAVLAIAVFTSSWWISERPQLVDSGAPSIHTLAIVNAAVIFFQVVLGAGFRHSEIPVWPHMAGALAVLATVLWTAVALRKRFGASSELSRARGLLHAIFGTQFLLGFGAYWARLESQKAGPTSATVLLTVTHTVVGALLFAFSILVVLLCYRLVPRNREALATTRHEATIS
jgi:cytochrome c oxidase assembly protein subunit 15